MQIGAGGRQGLVCNQTDNNGNGGCENRLWAVSLEAGPGADAMEQLYAIAGKRARDRACRRQACGKKPLGLIGEILMRTMVSRHLNCAPQKINISRTRYGKPYVKGMGKNVHFNVSHSGKWIIGALATIPIGVDVERIRDVSFDIARDFFPAGEYQCLMAEPEHDRSRFFYKLWVIRESYCKAVGKGLIRGMDDIYIDGHENAVKIVRGRNTNPHLRIYDIDRDYAVAACCLGGEPPVTVECLQAESLARLVGEIELNLHSLP